MANDLVKQGYNKIAENYLEERDQFENNKYLDQLISFLKSGSLILDIGCGSGIPIDRYLINKGFKIIGLDISEKQIELAKNNVPQANYEVRDMSILKEREYLVDAVISFYAIFHIPKKQHQNLIKKFGSFLSNKGFILITMGSEEWEGEEDDFHGTKMWWSHYGAEKNVQIIKEAGFEIISEKIDTSGEEKHQVILARKI